METLSKEMLLQKILTEDPTSFIRILKRPDGVPIKTDKKPLQRINREIWLDEGHLRSKVSKRKLANETFNSYSK